MSLQHLNRLLLPVLFTLFATEHNFGQSQDTLSIPVPTSPDSFAVGTDTLLLPDTMPVDSTPAIRVKKRLFWRDSLPSPKRAVILSAILPGAGQVYNGRSWYWKVPIIYGGLYAGYRLIDFNADNYFFYKDVYYCRVNNLGDKLNNPLVSNESIKRVRDAYFKQMQQSYVITFVWYLLNAADAFVEAHLLDFDVSDDLSLQVKPRIQFLQTGSPALGLGIGLQF